MSVSGFGMTGTTTAIMNRKHDMSRFVIETIWHLPFDRPRAGDAGTITAAAVEGG